MINSPAPLLPWPIYRDFAMKHGPTAMASEAYNYAMCDAAMQRLRVAASVLRIILSDAKQNFATTGDMRYSYHAASAAEALAAIGPLPDLPPQPGEGE